MLPNIVKKQKIKVKKYIKKNIPYKTETTIISTDATWNYSDPSTILVQPQTATIDVVSTDVTWNYDDPATELTQTQTTDIRTQTTEARSYLMEIPFVNWGYKNPSTILDRPPVIEVFGLQNIQIQTSPNFVGYDEISINDEYSVTSNRTESFLKAVNGIKEIHPFKYQTEEIIPDGVSDVFTHGLGTANFTVYVNGFKYTNVAKTTTTVTFDFIPRRMDVIELKAVTSNNVDFSVVLLGTVDVGVELKNYTEFKWRENKTEKNSQYEDHSTELRTVDTKYNIDLTFNDIKSKKEFFTEYKEKPFMLHLENEDGTNEYFGICEIVGNSEKNYFDRTYSLQIQSTDYWRDI